MWQTCGRPGFSAASDRRPVCVCVCFLAAVRVSFMSQFDSWCSPKSAAPHWYQNDQIQAPSGFHLVWISFLSELYRWILQCRHIQIFVLFWFMRFSELAQLGHQRHTIPLYWVADCELHLETQLILLFFVFFFSIFSSNISTGLETNTSLNQPCSTVFFIMKLGLMPTYFIKRKHGTVRGPRVPTAPKYDANHRHSARRARGKALAASGAFSKNTIKK